MIAPLAFGTRAGTSRMFVICADHAQCRWVSQSGMYRWHKPPL